MKMMVEKKANKFVYSEEEIKEAVEFVLKDNPNRKWKNKEEVLEAVENYLAENTVISNLEDLIKTGLVEEVAPNRFAPTKKGLDLMKE